MTPTYGQIWDAYLRGFDSLAIANIYGCPESAIWNVIARSDRLHRKEAA